jgi:acyl carrier protein
MSTASVIRASVAGISPRRPAAVAGTDRLAEDLAIDSMARLELVVLLEDRLGHPVADAVVMKAHTVADLVGALDDR